MKALLPLVALAALATAQAAGRRAKAEEAAPVLTAVFSAGERHSAIINGRLVKAGDSVGAYRIEDVLADGVRYRHAGTVRDLHLPHPADSVKKPATVPARGAIGGQ